MENFSLTSLLWTVRAAHTGVMHACFMIWAVSFRKSPRLGPASFLLPPLAPTLGLFFTCCYLALAPCVGYKWASAASRLNDHGASKRALLASQSPLFDAILFRLFVVSLLFRGEWVEAEVFLLPLAFSSFLPLRPCGYVAHKTQSQSPSQFP